MDPIQRKDRTLIATNRVWKVYFDSIESLDKQISVPEYLCLVPHASSGDIGGVTVIPEVDGHICLLKNYRYPVKSWVWEGARVFVDAGERPEEAARRELEEETNLTSSAWVPLTTIFPESGSICAKTAIFLARNCRRLEVVREPELGLGERHTLTQTDVKEMIQKGEIQDPSTLIGLLLSFSRYL
jgi:ADP-ribose pyrophosphatase